MRCEFGAPDYSHYDYAAEGVRMYEQGKREGAADKSEGRPPNHYLYVQASPEYSHAKGYREGFNKTRVPSSYKNPRSVRWDDWSLPQSSDTAARLAVEGVSEQRIQTSDNDNLRPVADATKRKGSFMQTWTGVEFYPLDARPDEIHIEDIAHALSMLCRYGGHGYQFYSVAEHSVHIYRWLLAQNYAPGVRLAGLLHDATEAYLVDLPRPVKRSLPEYKEAESRLWGVIADRFELTGFEDDLPVTVHEADNRILADEIRQNMTPMAWHDKHDDPLGVALEYWNPQRAEAEFLRAFREIQRVRQQQRRVG